jgi:hypothetical protein
VSEPVQNPGDVNKVRDALAREQERRRQERNTLRGRGLYSAATRDLAMEHARARIRAGATLRKIARDLGVPAETLSSWLGPVARNLAPAIQPPRLRPVTLIPEPGATLPPITGPTIILPSGVRICGLSMDQATELARVLK